MGLKYQSVKCSDDHCCALAVDHSFVCWGDYDGRVPDVSALGADFVVQDFSIVDDTTCALSTDGTVTCLGESIDSMVISNQFNKAAVRFSDDVGIGTDHFCIYEESDELLLQCMCPRCHGLSV